ncbi:MAG: hypothetical protein IJ024_03225 [Lachnospiraceae bacterium]|nr:hypothetical protein [Lachnospiraceae bacterium]
MGKSKRSLAIIVGILSVLVLVAAVSLVHVLSLKRELQPQLDVAVQENLEASKEEISIYLPETCYAAVGVPLEIYNSQISEQGYNISKYNVLWSCDIGENLERKYSLNPSEEMLGEHTLTVSVYDNALNLLAEKTCRLQVVDGKLSETYEAEKITLWADSEEAARKNINSIVEQIETIRSVDSEIPIYVANILSQEGTNNGVDQLMEELEEKLLQYENIYHVPAQICVDLKYNFDSAAGELNDAGMQQMEDLFTAVIYGTMK